ncbi:MAG: DUF1786 domain-containing protein [Desulfovibrionales bacterium]
MNNILCLDIGSGTQDVLYYQADKEIENCPKFILPAPAVAVSRQIKRQTRRGKTLFLFGKNMGGGFSGAVREHLKTGLSVSTTADAALAVSDNLQKVRDMGIDVNEVRKPDESPIFLADFDPGYWRAFLNMAGLDYPDLVLACAQDHGFHPQESNRRGRFRFWEKFLTHSQGMISRLLFATPPEEMTRLKVLSESIGCGLVADSGSAAALGALYDSRVSSLAQKRGICVVNIGNSHTVAFLVFRDRIWGIYEHHTGMLHSEKLWTQLERFRRGMLNNDEVFADHGHGCCSMDLPEEAMGFEQICVLGPKRSLLQDYEVIYPCPGGDMMLAGCFGLLNGYFRQMES